MGFKARKPRRSSKIYYATRDSYNEGVNLWEADNKPEYKNGFFGLRWYGSKTDDDEGDQSLCKHGWLSAGGRVPDAKELVRLRIVIAELK